MGNATRPATTKLRNRVVKAWNKGRSQAEIAQSMGLTRGVVGRLIAEARAMGMATVSYTPTQTAQRTQRAMRANMGDAAYRASMRQRLTCKISDQA